MLTHNSGCDSCLNRFFFHYPLSLPLNNASAIYSLRRLVQVFTFMGPWVTFFNTTTNFSYLQTTTNEGISRVIILLDSFIIQLSSLYEFFLENLKLNWVI